VARQVRWVVVTLFPSRSPLAQKQVSRFDSQDFGEFGDDFQSAPRSACFQLAHVGAVDARLMGQFFLREVSLVTHSSKIGRKDLPHIHPASERLSCLLTNRFKTTK
jgi:hypothetical protein